MQHKFGPYEVIEGIAEGSMGLVYRVKSPEGKIYALKTLRSQAYSEDDEESQLRFQREMELSLKIEHPHIVKVYECQLKEDPPYMVMDYVAGGSLADKLETDGKLSPVEVLKIAHDIASALEGIERKGIVHRDIKPANILIDGDSYKLTDLGLARLMESSFEDGITLSQTALGTPDYVSPEQVMHARGVDIRSDIYSLGASLYHCLTGRPVHQGGSQLQLMMKHINEPIIPPVEVNSEIPESLSVILMKMLERNLEDRYQTTEAILDDLELISIDGDIISDKTELVRPMNRIGMLMFSCFVLLVLFAGSVFLKMACLPPVEDDYFYQKQRASLRVPISEVSQASLQQRALKVSEFLNEYPRDLNATEMARAVELAKTLAELRQYKLVIKSVGNFIEARKFELRLFIGDQNFTLPSHGQKKTIYPEEKISFKWQPGSEVKLQLEEFEWVSDLVFDQALAEKPSLRELSGIRQYAVPQEYAEYFSNGLLQIEYHLEGFSEEDWRLFADYIYPGSKW